MYVNTLVVYKSQKKSTQYIHHWWRLGAFFFSKNLCTYLPVSIVFEKMCSWAPQLLNILGLLFLWFIYYSPYLNEILKYILDSSVGSTSTWHWRRGTIWNKRRRFGLPLWNRRQRCRRCYPRKLPTLSKWNKIGKRASATIGCTKW